MSIREKKKIFSNVKIASNVMLARSKNGCIVKIVSPVTKTIKITIFTVNFARNATKDLNSSIIIVLRIIIVILSLRN